MQKTPYYLYDGDIIHDRCAELADAFGNSSIDLFYAVKANDHPAITQYRALTHRRLPVSAGEMKRAMAAVLPRKTC